ncbi:hypothetical protein AALP_AA5G192000 [Arabis alpina]|uniref:Uncharacterized protein n=1 Tax=Arabis alpina TaxID=50452 RepID=A0A087GY22_ARAAL|nr:hypothetical protein AALP_AA5G192000 [Arabis alpina]
MARTHQGSQAPRRRQRLHANTSSSAPRLIDDHDEVFGPDPVPIGAASDLERLAQAKHLTVESSDHEFVDEESEDDMSIQELNTGEGESSEEQVSSILSKSVSGRNKGNCCRKLSIGS